MHLKLPNSDMAKRPGLQLHIVWPTSGIALLGQLKQPARVGRISYIFWLVQGYAITHY